MYKCITKLIKITIFLFFILPAISIQAANDDNLILHLKKKYYDENNISEFTDKFTPDDIYYVEGDINGDNQKEFGFIYGPNCGAAAYACNWLIYSLINGSYCEIGSLANESLSSLKNEPRTYQCRTKDNKLDLDEHGNQMTQAEIEKALLAQQPLHDEQQVENIPVETNEPPFRFAMEGIKNSWKWYSITSKMNGLKITKFTANRNAKNCESTLWSTSKGVIEDDAARKKAAVLDFGETAIYLVPNSCSVIEISIEANNKEWVSEFG
ncbi:hypothetical protein ACK348_11035 [Aeromonas veronii]|uniref:hypothetical protein n=1 Tax=Aeromonas veronii TaxID=654 RepID=UPI003A34FDEE